MRGRVLALGASAIGALVLASCRPDAAVAPAHVWPRDVVAAVDEVPITRAELERAAGWAGWFTMPDAVERQRQRVALTSMLIPRAALVARDPAAAERALEEARAMRATLRTDHPGPQPPSAGPVEQVQLGDLDTFGPFVLGAALELEPGEWSDPLLGFGYAHLVRRLPDPPESSVKRVHLGVIDFPYLPAGELAGLDVGTAVDGRVLELVDPKLADIVPEALQWRMRDRAPDPR